MARAVLNVALALLVVCAVQAAPRQRRGGKLFFLFFFPFLFLKLALF